MTEKELHGDVVKYLGLVLAEPAWFSTFPAGGGGRSWQRLLGLKLGVPDLLIVHGGRAYWIEFKTGKGRVNDRQRVCHDCLVRAGSPVAVVRSLEDAEKALVQWGVPLSGHIA